jgi:hypothetical protein
MADEPEPTPEPTPQEHLEITTQPPPTETRLVTIAPQDLEDVKAIVLAWHDEKLQNAKKRDTRKAYTIGFLACGILLVGCLVLIFALNGVFGFVNVPALIKSTTPTATETPTLTTTPSPTPTPKVAFAQMLESLGNVPWCDYEAVTFPCKYLVQDGDTFEAIARRVYGNPAYSGRLVELYREAITGSIPALKSYTTLIVPEFDRPLDAEYYRYYFSLLSEPILECDMPYKTLLALYYPDTARIDCLLQANRAMYTPYGLAVKVPNFGDMVVLPACQ